MCPACNQIYYVDTNSILEGTPAICERCGLDLTELAKPVPKHCDYTGRTCGNPCGRAQIDVAVEPHECNHWTPV